jgi:hypothetical protein
MDGAKDIHKEMLPVWAAFLGLSVLWVAYAIYSTLKPVPTLPR